MANDVTVSAFLGVSIIIIFLLYTNSIIKLIPCGKNILSTFSRKFIHTTPAHLFSNLFSLYTLTRVEKQLGSKLFFRLIVFLILFNTIIESIVLLFGDFKCSIGLSGLLFGITTYEMILKNGDKQIDAFLLLSIILLIVVQSTSPSISWISHTIGAISGIIGGFIWSKTHVDRYKNNKKDK